MRALVGARPVESSRGRRRACQPHVCMLARSKGHRLTVSTLQLLALVRFDAVSYEVEEF